MLLVAIGGMALLGCSHPTTPIAGVISTENAGRVAGSLVRSDGLPLGAVAEIRLVRLSDSLQPRLRAETTNRTLAAEVGPVLVARIHADPSGAYEFPQVEQGTYRIDAFLPGGLQGSSGSFVLQSDSTVRLVVVLVVVPSFQFALVPPTGDSVLSVWVGDPGRQALNSGSTWTIPVVPGVAQAVGVVVRRLAGGVDTVLYDLEWTGSVARLVLASTTATDPPQVGSQSTNHFGTDTGTVALWTFDTLSGGTVLDASGHGRILSAMGGATFETSPNGSAALTDPGYFQRAFEAAFTPRVSGVVVYEARVFLPSYPSSGLHNGRSVVMGHYEGLKLAVSDSGRLQVAGQQGSVDAGWNWFAPQTAIGVVPVGRWVDLAIAIEWKTGRSWAWVDGGSVVLEGDSPRGEWRIPTTSFVVGMDSVDDQGFAGKIDEMRVSRQIPSNLEMDTPVQ